jgi:hypothetical protein
MGVHRFFSKRRQNFPVGGQGGKITLYLPKAPQKDSIFLKKVKKKHTILAGQGVEGQRPLLPSINKVKGLHLFNNIFSWDKNVSIFKVRHYLRSRKFLREQYYFLAKAMV